jgi:serine phosphatase RsbU (regulator of sigma subunit)/catechol 2,3-dioxygenase-like lactoylglutathione lyase family enzyme
MDGSGSSALRDATRPHPHQAGPCLRFHAVKIYVRDQDRSLRFYLDQLGFTLVYDARLQSGERWVAVAPPEGNAILALVAPRAGSRQAALIGRPTEISFVTDDVLAKFREWSKRGVKFWGIPRLRRIKYEPGQQAGRPADTPMLLGERNPAWGGVFARFEDIDGNVFSLVSFDEVSEALEAQRREAARKVEIERRNAQELEIAKQVQARLFPQTLPKLATLDYAGICIQARKVGGDYYDFLNLGRSRLGLVIGDIAGKGIAAALLMANLQANLRSQCTIASDQPQALLKLVNRLFLENTTEGAYATLFFAEYHDETGCLRYVNCGHVPALLLRSDDSVERLDSNATVLGIFADWDCSVGERRLLPGDTLFLYSDGVTEAFNESDEEYGEARLVEVLRRQRGWSSRALLEAVVEDLRRFSRREQHDDITLIVAGRTDGRDGPGRAPMAHEDHRVSESGSWSQSSSSTAESPPGLTSDSEYDTGL